MDFERGKLCVGCARIGWKLGFVKDEKNAEVSFISADDMPFFTPEDNGGIWKNEAGLTVKVEYGEIDGIVQGHLSFSGGENLSYPIEEIHFPCASMPFEETVKILVPRSQGQLLDDFSGETFCAVDIYRTFRCTALLYGGHGIYFDCRDSGYYNKKYQWLKDGETLIYSHIHYLPLDGKGEYTMPYRSAMTAFAGDWFEAAMIYKKWACRQIWYQNASKEKNPLKDISMWFWNRGRIDHVLPPVEKIAEDAQVPVALDWYWWHHNPYDTDYPDFWPPREGEEAFKAAVKRMNDQGIFTQVYINGRTWDLDGPTYHEGGADEIEYRRDGSEFAVVFNTYNHHRLGYMCGEATVFQQKMADLVKTLCDAGLPGVYLDMIGCSTGSNCYNPKHKHLPGGGEYNIKGFRKMIERIRKENPGKLFSTEDCAESWMDLFDSMIVFVPASSERMGYICGFVPFFNAVYHGANVLFGSYALPDGIPPWDELWPAEDRFPPEEEKDWNALYPCQFYLELARHIVWGMQPMVCNFQMKHIEDPAFAEVYKFIVDTAKFYYENRELLYSAEMDAPGELECRRIALEFISRSIFTKKDKMKIIHKDDQPAICHGVWKKSDGGRVLILANYTPEEQEFRFENIRGILPARSYKRIELS